MYLRNVWLMTLFGIEDGKVEYLLVPARIQQLED
jgi:hypothetical protein